MSILQISALLLKNLFRGPATRRYPAVKRAPYAATRGGVDVDPATCILCMLCQKKCPTQAIAVDRGGRTWSIRRVNCLACGACVECCPKKSIAMHPEWAKASTEGAFEVFPIDFVPPQPKPAASKTD
jgi:formate hydrogenlyase subunit 6/NADH:ubiquinone oxidoreductase subunit I